GEVWSPRIDPGHQPPVIPVSHTVGVSHERAVVQTPIGGIGVTVDDGAVTGVSFGAGDPVEPAEPSATLAEAIRQLREYFAGERVEFDLPLMLTTGTEFERAVWKAIAEIPYGETKSYGA